MNNYTKEMIDYKLKMIKAFFDEDPESNDEEVVVEFIKEREVRLRNSIDQTFDLMNRVYNARVFEFVDHSIGMQEYIVANSQEEAMNLLLETLIGSLLTEPKTLEIQELDIFKEEMLVDLDLVPEFDRKLWQPLQEDDNILIVPLVYCIDYQMSATGETIPFFLG